MMEIRRMEEPEFSETFTVYQGTQVRTMYNIRLLALTLSNLFRHPRDPHQDLAARAQTASSLYGTKLNAMILLVTRKDWERWTVRAGKTRVGRKSNAFIDNCSRSTEFHFESIEKQLEKFAGELAPNKNEGKLRVEEGDYFITKHSNLPLIQVVFHLIVDEDSLKNELTTRSPVVTGYRHLLRTAYRHDVQNLTIPLLFLPDPSVSGVRSTQYSSAVTDLSILLRRAEVVLKATKGFMIETGRQGRHASGTGGVDKESRTLQFLLPSGTSGGGFVFGEESFSAMRDKVAEVFPA
ncbi:hypothetical protein M427DRAFT_388576 [Gonapodya prolifera JEL478]|uniref:Uncharacterized protein n=1 Tax=Gonapodya prolifera (strain JEL478) TaxID=1344416 RepID=A0A139A8L5_GONPJ|nr:hypothetical protein M427DRAFT_388576 [Gonapodya prolifera JEL478]|eukprot:KXS12795.1 hypothetical protein M427DRAFT_388576 [Gonapodya prolifera JEL478]